MQTPLGHCSQGTLCQFAAVGWSENEDIVSDDSSISGGGSKSAGEKKVKMINNTTIQQKIQQINSWSLFDWGNSTL